MDFIRYRDTDTFSADVLGILMENEAQNNLQIGIITESKSLYSSKWLLGTVSDDAGDIVLTAVCTPPFNLLLYETGNRRRDEAVAFLAANLQRLGFCVPGVLAERGLAHRFAAAYEGEGGYSPRISMVLMRLDSIPEINKAPGTCRALREGDLFFAPHWERAFSEECRVESFSIEENTERIKKRLNQGTHFFWVDCGVPVSQAVCGRKTAAGAVINSVYTPPYFRDRGYASSVVAELSKHLLENGKEFCCLFADEANPVSRGIYGKIGFYDLCIFDEIKFNKTP